MMFKRFARHEGGNFALTAALCMIPFCLAAGLAVDYSSKANRQSKLQDAVDAAVLAAGRDMARLKNKEIRQTIRQFLTANLEPEHAAAIDNIRIEVDRKQMRLQATADAAIPASFGRLAGIQELQYSATASVQSAFGGIEVVLVLDNTYSMKADGKLDALKTAAGGFVSDMMAANVHDDVVRIGVVPFGQYVNVGMHNRNASWMDVPPDSSERVCRQKRDVVSKSGCRTKTRTRYRDGVPVTQKYQQCTRHEYGEPYEHCGTRTVKWHGCAGSREHPLNLRDAGYGTRVPGAMKVRCPSPITPLSGNERKLKSQIDAMVASGETYVPAGLIWGLRTISSHRPFREGVDRAKAQRDNVTKAIVLMTDGENTKSKRDGDHLHNGGDQAQTDGWTRQLCEAIKSEEIVVYSMSFGDDIGNDTRAMLRDCANTANHYFHASDADALNAAFADIAASLNRLYLTQ